MGIHFFLKHWIVSLVFIMLIATTVSILIDGVLLFFIDKDHSTVNTLGIYFVGMLGLIVVLYYFLVEKRKDVRVMTTVEYVNKQILFTTQAFNNSKTSTVLMAKGVYITGKVPSHSKICMDYRNHSHSIPFIKFSKNNIQDYQAYYPLKEYGITRKISLRWDTLSLKINSILNEFCKDIRKHQKYYLTVLFVDLNDKPYLSSISEFNEGTIKFVNGEAYLDTTSSLKDVKKNEEKQVLESLVDKETRKKTHRYKAFYSEVYPLIFVFSFIVTMISPSVQAYKAIITTVFFLMTCFFSNSYRFISEGIEDDVATYIFQVVIALGILYVSFTSSSMTAWGQAEQIFCLLGAYLALILFLPVITNFFKK